jgi:hypothetical protein
MKASSFVGAFGGAVLLGATALPGSALAFGQQWRPAPGHMPNNMPRYQRVANVPNFRPSYSAAPSRYRGYGHASPGMPREQQGMAAQYARPGHATRSPAAYGMPYGYAPVQRMAPMVAPGWRGAPVSAMAQGWRPHAAGYPQQYGWQPQVQPWAAPRYAAPQPYAAAHYQTRWAPPVQSAWQPPQHHAAAAPSYRTWRPVAPAPGYHAPARMPQPAPVAAAVWMMDPASGTAAMLPAGGPGSYWRPALVADHGVPPTSSFRPSGYGRSQPDRGWIASQGIASQRGVYGATRDRLPGWATTHADDPVLDDCTWCGGS